MVCGQPDNDCSLRGAIIKANGTPELDTIVFDTFGMQYPEIVVLGPSDGEVLPAITAPVFLDGATGGATRVALNGFAANAGDGLHLVDHEGSTIKSMSIGAFNGDGIEFDGGGGHQVVDSRIGIYADGLSAFLNSGSGVEIGDQSSGNLIGSEDLYPANIISGNTISGVHIYPSSSGNRIIGNYIGLDATGNAPLPNGTGVLSEGIENHIGEPGHGNVISGNNADGMSFQRGDNVIQANLIGTTADGMGALGNVQTGVYLYTAENNVVGGSEDDERNVISGSGSAGVRVLGGTSHRIIGNYIGTNAAGTGAITNNGGGILVTGFSDDIQIGEAGAGNLISGNFPWGVQIDPGSLSTDIAGNTFGLAANQSTGMPNYSWNLRIKGDHTRVGGNTAAHRNVFGGQHLYAHILIDGVDAYENTVLNNYIGTDGDGMIPYNTPNGVSIYDGATFNFIGSAGLGNVISGNSTFGIQVRASDNNFVWSNKIGVAADGVTPLGNGVAGISFGESEVMGTGNDANNNSVGGEKASNIIANNGDFSGAGIFVWEGTGNRFSQNAIYDNPGMAIDLFPVGPNTNDAMDPDTGANNLQNHVPVQSAVLTGDSMHIQGQYNSNPNTTFTIEFFKNGTCSPSGAQSTGLEYFGSTEITTDGNGDATVDATFSDYVLEGPYITYLATHEDGSTSEGQNCTEIDVIPATPTPVPTETPEPTPTPTPGPTHTPGPSDTPGPTGTPSGKAVQGDTDCDEDVDTVDGLFVLRDVAGFPPSKCIENGDTDCDEDRDSVDALGILRHVAALPPLAQQEPCADIGSPV